MPKALAAFLWGILLGWTPASARIDCAPHCDYNHYYGPYDFTYEQPGLYGTPRCGPNGNCSPYLDYFIGYPRARVVIRPRPRTLPPRQ